MSFFRYPGGKSKLAQQIVDKLKYISKPELEYREPFFGGGGIGLKLFQCETNFKRVWINDKDIGIACLWTSVIKYPDELKILIRDFKPSVEYFDCFKSDLLSKQSLDLVCNDAEREAILIGFKKLVIHQISYSGLGTKSGGPLGGREQKSKYKIDCRWSPDYICSKIDNLNNLFKGFIVKYDSCTEFDFEYVIENDDCESLIYLDPPYFIKGNDLYQYGLSERDHVRLAELLKNTKHKWLLSYDDCKEIKELYGWANIEEVSGVNYSITALKDKETGIRISRTKSELLISNKKIK